MRPLPSVRCPTFGKNILKKILNTSRKWGRYLDFNSAYAGMSSTLTIIMDAEMEPPEFDIAVEEVYQVGSPSPCVRAASFYAHDVLRPTAKCSCVTIPQTLQDVG